MAIQVGFKHDEKCAAAQEKNCNCACHGELHGNKNIFGKSTIDEIKKGIEREEKRHDIDLKLNKNIIDKDVIERVNKGYVIPIGEPGSGFCYKCHKPLTREEFISKKDDTYKCHNCGYRHSISYKLSE